MNSPQRNVIVPIPVIETSRLRLRGHHRDDFPHCAAMWSDPAVTRFIGGKPFTGQQAWARLLSYVGHWVLMGFGYWVMEERDSGQFVGEIGFADFKRDIAASMQGKPELGFALASRFHGKGYASEAGAACLAWADANLPFPVSVCIVHAQNLASLRVLQKCGYEVFEQATYNEQPALFLARTAVATT